MRIREIVITGTPVLHEKANPVHHIDESIRELVEDMFATMELAPGVGLAAPQIGVDLALFVYDWVDEDDVQHRGVAINPTLLMAPASIQPLDDEAELEGCLSVPGERYPLRRSDRVLLSATDLNGNEFEIEAKGWLARIFQHEYDHLLGVLYTDRLNEPYRTECNQAIRELGWGEPGLSWLPGRDLLEG